MSWGRDLEDLAKAPSPGIFPVAGHASSVIEAQKKASRHEPEAETHVVHFACTTLRGRVEPGAIVEGNRAELDVLPVCETLPQLYIQQIEVLADCGAPEHAVPPHIVAAKGVVHLRGRARRE